MILLNKKDYIKVDKCIYKNKRTKKFVIDLFIGKDDFGGQKRTTKTFDNLKDARKYLSNFKNKKYQGDFKINLNKKDITFSKLIEEYIEYSISSHYQETTIASYINIAEHLKIYFKNIELKNVNSTKINQYLIYKQKQGVKCGTLKKHISFLNNVFHYAINLNEEYHIKKNPMNNILKLRSDSKKEYKYLTPNEIMEFKKIMKKEDNDLLLPFMIAAFTGMRRGEICGLSYNDIDFNNNIIRINRNCVSVGSQIILKNRTKTNTSREIIISEHLKHMLEKEYIKNKELKNNNKNYNPYNLVVVNTNGQILNPTVLSIKFKRFVNKHNVKKVTFHEIRHSFITNAINCANMSISDVSKTVGNSKEVCLRIYSHASENASQQVIKELDKIFENSTFL